jgi:predicted nucleic acid-binding protein
VADAGVLIWLAKAGRLNLLKDQYRSVIIPREVYSEVVEEGLREGYPDAHVVKEAVEQGWIRVEADPAVEKRKRLTDDLRELHEGEAAAIILAQSSGLSLLIDESSGRAVAEALSLAPRGSMHVVLRALHDGGLTGAEARDTISSMVSSGFRMEPRLLDRVLREVTHFKKA